jgi:phenylpyruvate tautomerase PptA (4-oxalocrotonate tautomerase family)
MPTYVCSVPAGSLTITQKTAVAEAIARIHNEATGAPQFLVQVIIDENQSRDRFLGGQLTTNHIWIRGDIRAGRTEEQRKKLMLNMVRDVSQITGVNEDSIWVYLCNLEPTDMVEYGQVLPAPGGEQAWFAQLPQPLKDYLARLGTNKQNFSLP